MKSLFLIAPFFLFSYVFCQHSLSIGIGFEKQNSYIDESKSITPFNELSYYYNLNINRTSSLALGLGIGYYTAGIEKYYPTSFPTSTFNPQYAIIDNQFITGSIPLLFNQKINKLKLSIGIVGDFNWAAKINTDINNSYHNNTLPTNENIINSKFKPFDFYHFSHQDLQVFFGVNYIFNDQFEAGITNKRGSKRKFTTLSLKYNFGESFTIFNKAEKEISPKQKKYTLGLKTGIIREYDAPNNNYNSYTSIDLKRVIPFNNSIGIKTGMSIGFYSADYNLYLQSPDYGNYGNDNPAYHDFHTKSITYKNQAFPINGYFHFFYTFKKLTINTGAGIDYNIAQNYNYESYDFWGWESSTLEHNTTQNEFKLFSGYGLNKNPFQFNTSLGYLLSEHLEIEAQYNYGANRTNYTIGFNYFIEKNN